jgi:ethanolaminephosphotransferase
VIAARRKRNLPITPALAGLVPFFATWFAIQIWLFLRPEIVRSHILPFAFFVGASFAYQVGLVITAHLTKSPFPYFNILLIPILAGTLDALGPFLRERVGLGWPSILGGGAYTVSYVLACLGLSIGVYGSFVVDVITNICDYMDIWCLTIKHPHNPDAPEGKLLESK